MHNLTLSFFLVKLRILLLDLFKNCFLLIPRFIIFLILPQTLYILVSPLRIFLKISLGVNPTKQFLVQLKHFEIIRIYLFRVYKIIFLLILNIYGASLLFNQGANHAIPIFHAPVHNFYLLVH